MPGLRFYGRKWQFGADDVAIPSCICSLLRITWITLLSVFYAAARRATESCSVRVYSYTTVALGVYCVTFLVYGSMLCVSFRGTVLETEKRWCMPHLFKFLTICVFIEAGLTVYGTYLATETSDPCQSESAIPYEALHAVVIGSWIDLFFSSCCACLALTLSSADESWDETSGAADHKDQDGTEKNVASVIRCCYRWGDHSTKPMEEPLISGGERAVDAANRTNRVAAGSEQDDEHDEEEDHYEFHSDEERESDSRLGSALLVENHAIALADGLEEEDEDDLGRTPQTWNQRCRRLCSCLQCFTCGLFGGMNGTGGPDAFQQVALVLAGWFKNLDLVPSDIVAALFLMRAEQREMERKAVQTLLRERLDSRHDQLRRRAFTHVGRWMWTSHGPNERANSQLHAQQIRQSRDARRLRVASSSSDIENTAVQSDDVFDLDPEARELLLQAADMAPYMLGMYGWMLFFHMHGVRGWLTVLSRSFFRCFRCCRRQKSPQFPNVNGYRAAADHGQNVPEDGDSVLVSQFLSASSDVSHQGGPRRFFVLDDGCCEWNTAALVARVGRKSAANADVVYASFTTLGGQAIPYSVCVDHSKRRVVVAVRGMYSIADAITHVTMVPAPLAPHAAKWGFEDEVEPDSHAHAGILRVAAWMRTDLQRQDILHRLFGISVRGDEGDSGANNSRSHGPIGGNMRDDTDSRRRAFSIDSDDLPDCRGYGLEITGHSLGGGVAVVLSLFLRPAFPNVRCMAFSPPGCVFDWKLANKCSSWVSCVFVGKDFAPRTSWHSLFKLRGQVLDTLRRDKATKVGAIVSAIVGRPIDQLLYKSDEVPNTKHAKEMERKIDELANRKQSVLDSVRLFAPGKLLHLMKDETVRRNCCSSELHYVPMWVDDRSALDEILLSSRMALDHFPDVVDSVLKSVVEEYCQQK